jgi:acetolactate synthase-1/2/3 large subunit
VKKRGAEILIEELKHLGVEVMFGIPGGQVIPLFDALYDSGMRFILTRHEQGAAHMADGYARATGKVGVCIATSGPGATNLVTGIATANFDSVPMVAITGQVKTGLIGNDAFQEADTTGITRSISKHNYLVRDVRDLARTVMEAFHIASTGRPGPVVVDLPVDVTTTECEYEGPGKAEMQLPGYRPSVTGNVRQIRLAADAINAAEKPVIYAGGGVIISGASELIGRLAHTAEIPVTTTLLGLGCFPETDPLSLKMLGMHGTPYANHAIQNADLIIAVGARFDDRVTGRLDSFAPHAKIIHIDVDPASISKSIQVDIPVVGDARHILDELLKSVKPAKHAAWLGQIDEWKGKYPLAYNRACTDGVMPQFVVEQIDAATDGKAIITTEVGQNQMWAAQWFRHSHPRHFISSGGLGTMGYGFPAAIGAQVGCPDAVVFDIAGDGSIQMNIQELATASYNKIPVKVAILNNGYLGMVRQWQELFYKKRYSATQLNGNPDFVKVAEAYGVLGIRVDKAEEVRPAIDRAIEHAGPVVLDFVVCPEENVFPMVPVGEAIDRMIGGLA